MVLDTPVAHRWLGRAAGAILFLGLASGLLLPKLAGAAVLGLALMAIVWLSASRRWTLDGLGSLDRLVLLAVALYVAVWLLGWLVNGLDAAGFDEAGRVLRLLLIIPLVLMLRHLDGLEQAWWRGLTVGTLLAGAYAWWFFASGQLGEFEQRVGGATNPIYFGGIVLAMGLMLLPRVQDPELPGAVRALAALAVLMALSASALSGSRGAWAALPPLLLFYALTLGARQPLRWRLGLPAGLLALSTLILFTPGLPLNERTETGLSEISALIRGEPAEDALGHRIALWGIGAELLAREPLSGVGPGVFRAAVAEAIDSGRLDERFEAYRHPHNQYLSALLQSGPLGLLSLALLLILILRRHARLWQTGLERPRYLGWTGLVAVVTFATMALTESIFERNIGILWFCLLTALPLALVQSRRRQILASPARRSQRLSVIIICKNEADRIGRCLGSVAGWADEIIVLDSGSSDDTVAIARRYSDQVFETDWPGFGRQKQRALDRASGDWVLSLDADEWPSEELKREIDQLLAADKTPHQGYCLPWLNEAFGRPLRYGHWARAPLRLFRRDLGRFTEVPVHEKVVLAPGCRIGYLEGPLHHRVYRDLDHARAKLHGYAELGAADRHARGKRVRLPFSPALRAAFNFLDNYVFRAAFLNGRAGLLMSRLYAEYTYQKYETLRKLGRLGD